MYNDSRLFSLQSRKIRLDGVVLAGFAFNIVVNAHKLLEAGLARSY